METGHLRGFPHFETNPCDVDPILINPSLGTVILFGGGGGGPSKSGPVPPLNPDLAPSEPAGLWSTRP